MDGRSKSRHFNGNRQPVFSMKELLHLLQDCMVGIFLSGSIVHAFLRSGYRSAPDFIPGEKPPVSLVFPTEIEHYSCFRLYSGLKKKQKKFLKTPFPAGKHRKRGILNLQLLVFYQMSGICYFQLLQGMAPYGSCATPKYSVCPTFSGQAPRREEWGLYLRKTERNSRKHCSKAPFPALETALRPTGKPGK